MAATPTRAELEAELTSVRAARLRIIENEEVQGSVQGRQTTRHGMSSLEFLNKQEQYLLSQLSRLDASGNSKGIRPRYGVPVR